jgi:hypothetical protein
MQAIKIPKERLHLKQEMIAWCLVNVGPGGTRLPDYTQQGDYWGVDQYNSGTFFFFVVPEDGTLFALRWL